VAFTSTITRIVRLLVSAGRIGPASERRTSLRAIDTGPQIFQCFRQPRGGRATMALQRAGLLWGDPTELRSRTRMRRTLKIDFVSDISCPWCVIGLRGLETGLEQASDVVAADIVFQPFELNPDMPREGQNIVEHVAQKYGATAEQSAANREMIRERAAAVGFTMATSEESRIYNTFDAHRLLHWAGETGAEAQRALKLALFEAYFTEGRDPSDPDVLVAAAAEAGLDPQAAREILASGRYAEEVRDAERLWQSRGIHAVPAVIVDGKYLISGGQPPEAFEQALRRIAAEAV
jgi:predicted DsbA family dithiol-disulfide isomerase